MLRLEDFWAKTAPFQSVLVHGYVTGTVAQIVYSEVLSSGVQEKLQKLLGIEQERTAALLGYLASLHDIGKMEGRFQKKDARMENLLREAGLYADGISLEPIRHEKTSKEILSKLWKENETSLRTANLLGKIAGAHHQGKWGKEGHTGPLWKSYHVQYEQMMREYFGFLSPLPELHKEQQGTVSALLLGILIISDWIASSCTFEEAEAWAKEAGGRQEIERRARRFLEESGLQREEIEWPYTFSKLWTNIPEDGLRPLQKEIERLFATEEERLSAVLIEAPMGEGKTEAGMFAALRMLKQWGKGGFYVALPTAATSNQMVGRMRDLIQRHDQQKEVRLLHGMAWLVDAATPEEEGNAEDDAAEIRKWLSPMRRALLSPYAVGTVDQVMLSVTKVRYGVLRLLGLANKALVIDEIHSYDVYMSEFIVLLLHWCKALEIPVVMLSATLPPDMKRKLLLPFGASDGQTCYPAITAVTGSGRQVVYPIAETSRRQTVRFHLCDVLHEPGRIASLATEKVKDGGCLCILLNTVRQAQETYLALRDVFEGDLLLFHAQFPAGRRDEIEKTCLRLFGPDKTHRPHKAILVATQVVEQSLDVDFDGMITAVAPVDLLFQRAGRVFRHAHTLRPETFSKPCIDVLIPGQGQDLGVDGVVYPESLLKQSIHLLEDRSVVRIPEDLAELVSAGYDMAQVPESELEAWLERMIEDDIKAGSSEIYKLSPPEKAFSPLGGESIFDDGETDSFLSVKTRLGEPSVRIALLEPDLYARIRPQVTERDGEPTAVVGSRALAQKVLEQSVSVQRRRLQKIEAGHQVIKGEKLLTNVMLYPSECGIFKADNGGSIAFDRELGVVIKEGDV